MLQLRYSLLDSGPWIPFKGQRLCLQGEKFPRWLNLECAGPKVLSSLGGCIERIAGCQPLPHAPLFSGWRGWHLHSVLLFLDNVPTTSLRWKQWANHGLKWTTQWTRINLFILCFDEYGIINILWLKWKSTAWIERLMHSYYYMVKYFNTLSYSSLNAQK